MSLGCLDYFEKLKALQSQWEGSHNHCMHAHVSSIFLVQVGADRKTAILDSA